MKLRIENQEIRLDDLYRTVETLEESELKVHLSRYLCIRSSGFLENVVKDLIILYVTSSSSKYTANFVETEIRNFTNVTYEKLVKLLQRFCIEWATDFESQITDKQKNSLNSIIANRNSIAHGHQDNLSFNSMKSYYSDLKEIIKLLKTIIQK